jgi:hypothetical protein
MNRADVTLTTTAGGDATGYTGGVNGKLYAIEYLPGTLDTGATVTVTCGDTNKALLTKASAGTSNVMFYPRDLVHGVADGAALTGTSGGDRALPVLFGRVKVVIASGGNVATGRVVIYYE